MKQNSTPQYPTSVEIAQQIETLERRAMGFSPTSRSHRSLMKELAQLRAYAEMKNWLKSIVPIPRAARR